MTAGCSAHIAPPVMRAKDYSYRDLHVVIRHSEGLYWVGNEYSIAKLLSFLTIVNTRISATHKAILANL